MLIPELITKEIIFIEERDNMFDPNQLKQMFNELFSPEEQEKIAELQTKSFDEQIDGFADIVQNNSKIPESQKKMFQAIANDDEIKAEIKEVQETAENGGLRAKATLAVKVPKLMMKIQKKASGM